MSGSDKKMTQDELIIEKFCTEYGIELKKIDSYEWDKQGYVINSDGRIEVLNLHALEIKKIPAYIAELSDLKILHLVGNKLTSIKAIGNLTKLEILVIRANEVKDISVVRKLKNLREFSAPYNPIVGISSLNDLENLECIELSYDDAIDFGQIRFSTKLIEFSLHDIKEHANIAFLRNCKDIKYLSLSKTFKIRGDDIFIEIFNNIKHLNLLKLSISDIKFDIENIKNFPELKRLDIWSNDIKDIRLLSRLTKLEELSINNIVNTQAISKLTKLKSLILYETGIKKIHFLSNLTELEELDLSANAISNIQPISELTKLKTLDIENNKIKNISPLKNLKHLKSIDLSGNPINDIAPLLDLNLPFIYDIDNSASENEIIIAGCDEITNPPLEIVQQGDEAIRRYFDKIKKEGFDYIYEAKLILVGEGGSGKTSLQKRLLKKDAELPKDEERTRGIKVSDLVFEEDKIAHIWDFGGQVVYYPVHRFFITENSVFVLLASTRQNHHNFDYWIPTIYQFGGESPIIIGQTCHDGNTAQWSDLGADIDNAKFNIVKKSGQFYHEINLPNNNQGLDTIKKYIIFEIENLHHFGKSVPKSWLTVRNALLKESELTACFPFQSFVDLCRRLEPVYLNKMEDIIDCCEFLSNIGVILWYKKMEELRDWVILRPDWAMNAVYRIIDDEDIQKNNGHILPADFERLWKDDSYEGKESILKKMLEKFKIAFPTKGSQGKEYILPARLNPIPSEKKWGSEKNSLLLEYKFEFMPKGIINQLSAELSRYISDNDVWNNAVNFVYEGSKSQIIEDNHNRKLIITSKGADARGINILIMNAINNIIKEYKEVKAEIRVKCTCAECLQSKNPSIFPYDQLIEKLKKNDNAIVTCNRSDKTFKILELLYNVGFKKMGTQQSLKIVSVFLASSEELKGDRDAFEIFINRENKELINQGIFLKLDRWEDFIDKMSQTRLQDEYNKAAINSDIFISLFWTKVGKYTSEEFNVSHTHFKENGKPFIYTYFKNAPINTNDVKLKNVQSKDKFLNGLKKLGHYPTTYEDMSDLKYQFKMQLQKILPRDIQ